MTHQKATLQIGWDLDNSYRRLPKTFFSTLAPTPVQAPKLTILNESLAEALGLESKGLQHAEGVAMLAGNQLPEGATPLAQAYAGHQFGHFTKLGDGRAILLGEQITPLDERLDIQLKGSGRTPYSRGGDGRAALGPMLREYIISEAMFALGIPTTRSLAVVTTGESVYRETEQIGAILTRVAASHIRVGTFQYAAQWGTEGELQALADYTIERHFPHAADASNPYIALLQEVIKRQAELITKWQLVGFIHGVMNTDNMALSGETIDYGPCAFMDTYDPATVFSSIDVKGRYAYGNQPYIAGWNLARFAETLLPLLADNEEQAIQIAQDEISLFAKQYYQLWLEGMRGKLGLFNEEQEDEALIKNLLAIMQKHHADYTNTFRSLTLEKGYKVALLNTPEFLEWNKQWQERLARQKETKKASQQLMKKSNPAVIPRNHRVEEALEAAVNGDDGVMKQLLKVLACPFAYSPEQIEYTTLPEPSHQPYKTYCGT